MGHFHQTLHAFRDKQAFFARRESTPPSPLLSRVSPLTPKVCILGGGFQNKGAEAMTVTVFRAVTDRFPGAKVYVRVPQGDFPAARKAGLLPLPVKPEGMLGKLTSKIKTTSLIATGTTLIDISGFQFGDAWPAYIAERRAATVKHFTRRGNSVFFMPQAWGPFKNANLAEATRDILESATLSYVRDQTSLKAVQALAVKDGAQVRFAHDLAWNFQGAEASVGDRFIAATGLPPRALTVCVTPNMRVYERSEGEAAGNQYIRFLVGVIEHLCRAHGARIIILGHELRNARAAIPDDRFLGELILSAVDPACPVAHVREQLTAEELKSVIGRCDLLISSRYHALIAALSQNIPVAAAGWSHKYVELLEETHAGCLLSADDQPARTRDLLDQLVAERLEMQARLRLRLPAIRQNSQEAMDRVLNLIADRKAA